MSELKGRRIYPKDNLIMSVGDYGFYKGIWYGRPPGQHSGNFKNHTVVEHEDGTITVSPSILITSTDKNGKEYEAWHGYLIKGIWKGNK